MSLPGWNATKKLKLTIDSSKIDEELTDFPVLLNLSDSCGQSNFDASAVFDELSVERISDSFTGINGSLPDSDLWTCSSNDIQIYNNKLRFNDSTSVFEVTSNFYLYGDFSIQVDFDLTNSPSTNAWAALLQFKFANGDYIAISRGYSSAHRYTATRYINGSGYWNHYNSSETSGKFQITRTGNTFSFYRWSSSSQSWHDFYTGEVQELNKICYIQLVHNNWSGNPSFGFDFDNFSINYGNVFFPKRLTVSATVSGAEAQCYTEIESWDTETKEAVLWTKVPTAVSGANTELSLYYDVDHVNDSYIGLTRETAAQNVWDDNFVGVWHMADDPALSDNCIPDSTVNANDGSPGGSMTTADLVDGKIGKAIDFDKINDIINCGSDSSLDGHTNRTFEACIKFRSFGEAGDGGILIKNDILLVSDTADSLIYFQQFDSNDGEWTTPSNSLVINTDYYVAATYNKSSIDNDPYLFINGISQTVSELTIPAGTAVDDSSYEARIGNRSAGDRTFDGIIDEVRFSKILRSPAWIKTTYYSNWDNLNTFSSFERKQFDPDWLSNWTNRAQFIVDHTKIDEDLIDFPILISLDYTSCPDFFNELDYGTSVDDDFTGVNGSAPNAILWRESDSLDRLGIYNNKLKFNSSGSVDVYSYAHSNWNLTGDFDIQVDFDITTLDAPSSSYVYANTIRIHTTDNTNIWSRLSRSRSAGINGYCVQGSSTIESFHNNADMSGKLRLTRNSGVIKGYYWHNSQWEWNGSTAGFTFTENITVDIYITLHSKQESNATLNTDYDNFTVNSGTITWPIGTHPNRKKLAITSDNGTTQCPVEIEQFDFLNKKVNLWTKIPLVEFDIDTDFYLYYDKTKDDNTTYVGDIGSSPGRDVWDSDFVGVWHMCQDPSGGSDCVKDSTSNTSHLTPDSSMTTANLVDGKVGKALDFNGSSDYLVSSIDTILHVVGDLTTEIIIKRNTTAPTYTECVMGLGAPGESLETNWLYSMWIETDKDLRSFHEYGAAGTNQTYAANGTDLCIGVFQYAVISRDVSVNELKYYLDGIYNQNDIYTNNPEKASSGNLQTLFIGSNENSGAFFDGITEEVRISDVIRSAAWIKATYYSNWNNLLTITTQDPYYFSGYVYENDVPVARKINVHRRTGGQYVTTTESTSAGYYYVTTPYSGEHYLTCFDDLPGEDFNDLILGRMIPNEV